MKNDSTTLFLNFVLAALVLLGVIFAMMSMSRTSYLRKVRDRAGQTATGSGGKPEGSGPVKRHRHV